MRLFLRRVPALGALLLFALLCAAALAGPKHFRGHAATLIVSNTADSGAGSLRHAIAAASWEKRFAQVRHSVAAATRGEESLDLPPPF